MNKIRALLAVTALFLALPLAHAGFLMIFSSQSQTTTTTKVVFITSGTTWTVPSDFTSVNTIIGIGGGGGGAGGSTTGGGGGGSFATISNITLIPGASIPIQIGSGGAGGAGATEGSGSAGTDTTFNTSTVIAKAGGGGSNLGTGGAGGLASASTPTLGAHNGGNGSTANSNAATGGGGGGAGGPNGNGANGSTIANSLTTNAGAGGGASDGGAVGVAVGTGINDGVAGGAAFDGTAGGTGGVSLAAGGGGSHGSGGGGGGGTASANSTGGNGGAGGTGIDYTATAGGTAGPGGGAGGGGGVGVGTGTNHGGNAGAGGLYGGGGGGGGFAISNLGGNGGAGANGIIIVSYQASGGGGSAPVTALHYAAGSQGLLGFNLADVSTVAQLNALPSGYKGLVYLGIGGGGACVNASNSLFTNAVTPFLGNTKLWGFYITDEPLAASCTAADLKSDVDYIHTNFSGVKTFVVLENLGTLYSPSYTGYLTPTNSDLDYVGLDPYPARNDAAGGFDTSIIGLDVTAANFWPLAQMIPVYQAFGNYCPGGVCQPFTLPTLAQEQSILLAWGAQLPTPAFDLVYSYGIQCPGTPPTCDNAVANTGYLQTFYQQRNGVPPPPVILGPTGVVTTAQATITGTGAAVGDIINVCIDGTLVTTVCTGGSSSGTATVNSSLTWSFNSSPLANSAHTVVATETNSNGSSLTGNIVNFTTNVTVATTYTLDPAKTTSTITLSNGNLTSAVTAAGTHPVSLGTLGYSTGKYHFELQLTGAGNTQQNTGIATTAYYNGGAAPAAPIGEDVAGNSISMIGGGINAIYYKNVQLINNAGLNVNQGDLIAVEVDIGAGLFWAQDVTTGGGWNGSGTANPGTGTGGASFTPGGQTWYVADEPVQGVVAGRSQTVNFGASQFTAQCSTNFIPWNASTTACPPPPTSGSGLSTPVTFLPSDLPTTHWHTTARPWTALNTPASAYKTAFTPFTNWLASHLDSNGCVLTSWDPYTGTSAAGGTIATAVGASFQVNGDTMGLASQAIASMTCDVNSYSGTSVFEAAPFNTQLQLMAGFPGALTTAWRNRLNSVTSANSDHNQQVIKALGLWEGQVAGLSAYTSANIAGTIDSYWNPGTYSLGSLQFAPWWLFEDRSSTPDTLSVEVNGRAGWLTIIADGFNGSTASAMRNAQFNGSLTKLLTQGPSGDVAPNGRTDNHVWVDAAEQFGYETLAQLIGNSNSFLAGQYQRAAELAFSSVGRFINPQCCNSAQWFVTKNHFDPALRESYQTASSNHYNLGTMTNLAYSYQKRAKGAVIAETPAPTEIGGYAFALDSNYNAAFMNAGGTLAQINLQGDVSGSSGNIWTALGINRINRVGWENRLGPSDGQPTPSAQVSFAPTWITSGTTWTRLPQNPSSCSGSFTTTFAAPTVDFGKVVWTCSGGPTFTQNLTVTPDGVLSQVTCSGCPSTWGMTFPIMITDGTTSPNIWGATTLTTSIPTGTGVSGIASTTWPSSSDQQNYMTIGGTGSNVLNEGQVTMPFGNMDSVRVWAGTGTTSDTTQTTFVYPRNSSDPSAASVQSGMTITGTNTYTNSALSSSVVSGGAGTYYIGRTAAGGWAQTLSLPGGAMTFNVPCKFIARLNSGGQVTGLEVDRNVTATYVGAVGTHTNVSLTAYTPVTNQ